MKKRYIAVSVFFLLLLFSLSGCQEAGRETEAFSTDLKDEVYIVGTNNHVGWWEGDIFRISGTPKGTEHYRIELKIGKEEVEALLQELDLAENNLSEKLASTVEEQEEGRYVKSEEFIEFSISGEKADKGFLALTSSGEIYVKGYRYNGEKESFYKAFRNLIEAHEKEFSPWQYRDWMEDINWK